MSNIPNWVRCETCLWWAFSGELTYFHSVTLDKSELTGCIHPDVNPQIMSCFYRCPRWQCRRCLRTLEDIMANWPDIENHNYCKRVGRGRNIREVVGFLNGEEE